MTEEVSFPELVEDSLKAFRARVIELDHLSAVREFHEAVGAYSQDAPGMPWIEVQTLREDLIREELAEFCAANANRDLVGVADALGDLLYVVYGAMVAYGLPAHEIFNEIHASNMTKVGGPVREDGKILKPDTYRAPDLERVLREVG